MRISFTPDTLRALADFVEDFEYPHSFSSRDYEFAIKNPQVVYWYDAAGKEHKVGKVENDKGLATFTIEIK